MIEILVEDIDHLGSEFNQMRALPPLKKRKMGFRLTDDDDED